LPKAFGVNGFSRFLSQGALAPSELGAKAPDDKKRLKPFTPNAFGKKINVYVMGSFDGYMLSAV